MGEELVGEELVVDVASENKRTGKDEGPLVQEGSGNRLESVEARLEREIFIR